MQQSDHRGQGGSGPAAATVRRHVWVSGRVQGVGYRYSCAMQAATLPIGGWVRNLADGRVEAAFEGPESAVAAMIEWCWSGPRAARVTGVDVVAEPVEGSSRFAVTA